MNLAKNRIILGIDPGTQTLGYGIIEIRNKKPFLLGLGAEDLGKHDDLFLRMQKIFEKVDSLVKEFSPDEMALEAPFFGKNIQVMLKLGRAQGVAMAAGLQHKIPIAEYSPRKVKQSITGNGNASKEQVAAFVFGMMNMKELPTALDATDGVAVAMCHFLQSNSIVSDSPVKSWKDFIHKNPNRLG